MRTGIATGGIRYAVKKSGGRVACCSVSIKGGTASEGALPEGTAHFVEHTVFKGTSRHGAAWINSRLDLLGGELNAYTTKEEIVLHATVLKEDLRTALDLLLELATEASFPQKDIEIERGVVIDEIRSVKDMPADDIYDSFEGLLFGDDPLGRRILGTAASVRKIRREHLTAFKEAGFRPERMAVAVVSGDDEKKTSELVERMALKYFGTCASTVAKEVLRSAPAATFRFEKVTDKRNHEVNAILGGPAPSLYEEKDRICAAVLANILGGPGGNSLLNACLRERKGWVYGVECTYTQYSRGGVMAISLGCERENLEKCLAATRDILDRLISAPLSEAKLRQARRQILGQIGIASDNPETQCLSMGRSLLAFGRVFSPEEERDAVCGVGSQDLQAMAARLFRADALSTLIFL